SGTAKVLIYTGSAAQTTQSILEDLLQTHAGLTAGDMDIGSASVFNYNLGFTEKRIHYALAKVAEASEGYLWTDHAGKLRFTYDVDILGLTSGFEATGSHNLNLSTNYDMRELTNKVIVRYMTGTDKYVQSQSVAAKGRTRIVANETILSQPKAESVAQKLQKRYDRDVPAITLDGVWLPSIDINDTVNFTESNVGLTLDPYEVYHIREDITNLRSKISLVKKIMGVKFGYVGSDGADANPVTTWANGDWSENSGRFAFVAYDTATAVDPAFDNEGNDNGTVDG
ncbi:unnamed protein product, partial [marine sediment metagenome]